jgi:hypothetical protein
MPWIIRATLCKSRQYTTHIHPRRTQPWRRTIRSSPPNSQRYTNTPRRRRPCGAAIRSSNPRRYLRCPRNITHPVPRSRHSHRRSPRTRCTTSGRRPMSRVHRLPARGSNVQGDQLLKRIPHAVAYTHTHVSPKTHTHTQQHNSIKLNPPLPFSLRLFLGCGATAMEGEPRINGPLSLFKPFRNRMSSSLFSLPRSLSLRVGHSKKTSTTTIGPPPVTHGARSLLATSGALPPAPRVCRPDPRTSQRPPAVGLRGLPRSRVLCASCTPQPLGLN